MWLPYQLSLMLSALHSRVDELAYTELFHINLRAVLGGRGHSACLKLKNLQPLPSSIVSLCANPKQVFERKRDLQTRFLPDIVLPNKLATADLVVGWLSMHRQHGICRQHYILPGCLLGV